MYDNAIACCKKIRRYAPENDDAALLLGRFYAAKGLRADAARELEAYAERMERAGQPKEAMAALADVVGLGLDKPLQREKLARLYAENGQRDAAVQEYRALRRDYEARGDQEAVARIGDRLAEHGDRPPKPAAPDTPVQVKEPKPLELEREDAAAPPAAKEPSAPAPIPLGLEIEHTSYSERAPASDPDRPTAEPAAEARGGYAEMVSLAERAAAEGDPQRAADQLIEAGRGFTSQRRWEEAVDAYRRLAALGSAKDEHYAAWTEAARQLGMASLVLEALSSQAHWHVEGGRRSSARKAAEEMLLVDPQNQVATEILSKVGSTLPRD